MQILYVSDTDVCRGPMARALSLRHAETMGVVGASFDSVGLWVTQPSRPSRELVEFLRDDRLDITRHMSKPLQPARVRAADLIVCMTHRLAEKTKKAIEKPYRGKVLVLNDAVGFGAGREAQDILPPRRRTPKEMLAVYSRVKAGTGRLVRMLRDGNMRPEDWGVEPTEHRKVSYLDDPELRPFLVRFVEDLVERASEGVSVRDVIRALDVLGRPLSAIEVEELLRHDLRGKVRRNYLRRWEAVNEPRGPRASAGGSGSQSRGPSARGGRRRPAPENTTRKKAPPPPKKPQASARMTFDEALEVLTVKRSTPREEARKIYRKLLMRYHPDKFHDDDEFRQMAEEKTKRLNLAWDVAEMLLPKGTSEPNGRRG
ncbi:MAG: Low molecular weight phosphotyrosine protein phosphatase [Candidatus Sumerlaeota bacterium]|nr:Low molecular weight phosphotyrosine protein phosphatase [Candidatus Sumerlaeota bacterium]